MKQQTALGWSGVAIATLLMILVSALILYPTVTMEKVLTALRLSSVTTALPFLLVFVAKPLTILDVPLGLGQWLQRNRRYLWLTLTISHLLHLYQIWFFYQLGQSCPLVIWAITSPLWIIMVLFSIVEIAQPQRFDLLAVVKGTRRLQFIYGCGVWYVWLVFTLAFGSGAIAQHLPFYNIPALILFLAGGVLHGIVRGRRAIAT